MSKKRRRFSAEFKFRVALEAAKGQQTIGELAGKHGIHPNQISQWKRQLLEDGADVFSRNGSKEQQNQETIQSELYEQIGRLKMELEWLFEMAASFATQHTNLPATLFAAAPPGKAGSGLVKLVNTLKSQQYTNLEVKFEQLSDIGHFAIGAEGLTKGLISVFHK